MGRTYAERARSLRFRTRAAMVKHLNDGLDYGKDNDFFHPDKGSVAKWSHPSKFKPRGCA